jgi:septum formation protein
VSTAAGVPPSLPEAVLRAPLALASSSPRRQEILRLAGLPFEAFPSEAEPAPPPRMAPVEYCQWAARGKAAAVAEKLPGRLVVGADTIVVLGREILGKPADLAAARAMLRRLSGRQHTVYTGLAVMLGPQKSCLAWGQERSLVTFRRLAEAEIERYVATGDPLDKAGAYGIQSQGGELVAEVVGSYLNVVGLPLARLRTMLAAVGWVMQETHENEAPERSTR